MNPLVSVVIPTLNRPEYLRTAVASVLAQSLRDIEIIIHDNASRVDPSVALAGICEPSDERPWIIHVNETTIPQTPNIIGAVLKARGKYVAILGDDDVWAPGFLEALVAPMEADDDIVVAFCDHDFIDAEGRIDPVHTEEQRRFFARHVIEPGVHSGDFEEVAMVYRAMSIVSGAVIRRDAIDWAAFPMELKSFADTYIAYLLTITGRKCYYVAERLMHYRFHAGQVMAHDHSNRGAMARFSVDFWGTFVRDKRVRRHAYFRLICFRKALRVVQDRFRRHDWRGFLADFRTFARLGLIDHRMLFALLLLPIYSFRFRRLGIDRELISP